MKRLFTFVAVLLFFPQLGVADTLPQPDERKAVGLILQYLEDPGGKLTIEQVRLNETQVRFQASNQETPSFGFTNSTFWFQTSLTNLDQTPKELLLAIEYPLLDQIGVFIESGNQITKTYHIGDHQHFSQRPINHRNFLLPLELDSQQTVKIYFKVQTSSSMQFPLAIYGRDYLHLNEQTDLIIQGIYYGTMLVMMLYNLFLFISLREATYLYYVLYVASMALFQAGLHGFTFQHLWPGATWFNAQIVTAAVAGTVVFGGLFANAFLHLSVHAPRMSKLVLTIVTFASLSMALSFVLPYSISIRLSVICGISGSIAYLVSGLLLWKRGYGFARIYTIAWFSILAGAFAIATSKIGLLPRTFITENGVQIGSLLEVVLLSLALAQRLNQTLADKIKAERQSAKLEKALNAELQTKLFLFSRVAHELNNPLNYSVGHLARMEESCNSLEGFLNNIFMGSESDPEAQEALGIGQSHLTHLHNDLEGVGRSVNKTAQVIAEMRSVSEVDGAVLEATALQHVLDRVAERLEANVGPHAAQLHSSVHQARLKLGDQPQVFGNPYFYIHGISLAISALANMSESCNLDSLTHSIADGHNRLELSFTLSPQLDATQYQALTDIREIEIAGYLLSAQGATFVIEPYQSGMRQLHYSFTLPSDLTKS